MALVMFYVQCMEERLESLAKRQMAFWVVLDLSASGEIEAETWLRLLD